MANSTKLTRNRLWKNLARMPGSSSAEPPTKKPRPDKYPKERFWQVETSHYTRKQLEDTIQRVANKFFQSGGVRAAVIVELSGTCIVYVNVDPPVRAAWLQESLLTRVDKSSWIKPTHRSLKAFKQAHAHHINIVPNPSQASERTLLALTEDRGSDELPMDLAELESLENPVPNRGADEPEPRFLLEELVALMDEHTADVDSLLAQDDQSSRRDTSHTARGLLKLLREAQPLVNALVSGGNAGNVDVSTHLSTLQQSIGALLENHENIFRAASGSAQSSIATELSVTLSRLIDLQYAVQSKTTPQLDGEIDVLIFVCEPKGSPLPLARKEAYMLAGLFEKLRGIRVWIQFGGSPEDLLTLVVRRRPKVLHFIGHSDKSHSLTGEPTLAFTDKDGKTVALEEERILPIFSQPTSRLRLVFINGCSSEKLCYEINWRYDIPCVGWQTAVADQAAMKFAEGFYEGFLDTHVVRNRSGLCKILADHHFAHKAMKAAHTRLSLVERNGADAYAFPPEDPKSQEVFGRTSDGRLASGKPLCLTRTSRSRHIMVAILLMMLGWWMSVTTSDIQTLKPCRTEQGEVLGSEILFGIGLASLMYQGLLRRVPALRTRGHARFASKQAKRAGLESRAHIYAQLHRYLDRWFHAGFLLIIIGMVLVMHALELFSPPPEAELEQCAKELEQCRAAGYSFCSAEDVLFLLVFPVLVPVAIFFIAVDQCYVWFDVEVCEPSIAHVQFQR